MNSYETDIKEYKKETYKIGAATFLSYAALSLWIVPLSGILRNCGLESLWPTIFATGAIGTIISILFFGAIADF